MLQISPAETFPICRQLKNHLETDTLYVRSVIKDAINDKVLATVNLEDKGSYYFRYNWKVVWDNTMSRGRYITITTSIYSDSGYTTKHQTYGDEIDTYLVQERWDASKMQSIGGGGNYDGLNTEDVRKVISKELEKLKFPEAKDVKFPEQKEYSNNFNDISKVLLDIKALVSALPSENVDLSPVISKLDDLSDEIQSKPITPKTDLIPILKVIKEAQQERAGNTKETSNILNIIDSKLKVLEKDLVKVIKDEITKIMPDSIKSSMKDANFSIPIGLGGYEKESNINKLKSKFGIK